MFGPLVDLLVAFSSVAEPLGWLTILTFLIAVGLERIDQEYARPVFGTAWIVFGVFWLSRFYPYLVADSSFVKAIGALVLAPLSFLIGKVIYEGRDSLFALSRAVACMGLIYAPFVMITPLREQLVVLVVNHTEWVMSLLGHDPPVVKRLSELSHLPGIGPEDTIPDKKYPFRNTFVFLGEDYRISYSIIIPCTGIGSMAVMAGLIVGVSAPPRRKLRALALVIPIIYVLNIVRTVFIGLNYGLQTMQFFPETIMWLFGTDNHLQVSYLWADRILAQVGSVIALLVIFWLVLRVLPEMMDPVEELLYLVTGKQYDLADAFAVDTDDQPAVAD